MSYLEGYGVREAKREKYVKYALGILLIVVTAAIAFYFWSRDRQEKLKIEAFLGDLRKGDYKSAYALWGCTEARPCRDYTFEKFLQDWGPSSPQRNVSAAQTTTTKHCETGIIQFVQFPDKHEVQLWVEKKDKVIGFAPWPLCNPRMKVP